MRKKVWLFVLSAAACLLAAGRAEACMCSEPASPCAAYAGASAVFVGTVTDARGGKAKGKGWAGSAARRVYKFAVEEAFSGGVGAEVEVWTGSGGGDCGFPFERGARYVVYAQRDDETGRLSTSICTRTAGATGTPADLEFLRGMGESASGGTLTGQVVRAQRPAGEGDWSPPAPLADVQLVVTGEGFRRELRSDAEGRFQLSGLKPGLYRVLLTPPEGLTAGRTEQAARLADRGCAHVSFTLSDNGEVGGLN